MRNALVVLTALCTLALGRAAEAAIPSLFGDAVTCTVQGGGDAGERHCSGTFTTFDGAPIDVNVGLPPAPGGGPDGDFPIIGVFHGWGGTKLDLTSGGMQEWFDDGYAVFSMSDRGWGNSCGALDPNRLLPVCAEGYNHLMDTRFEVRDAQEVFVSRCAAAICIALPPSLTQGTSVPSPAGIIFRSRSAPSAIEIPPPYEPPVTVVWSSELRP